ncbi:murein hydrolase activator EnvC family protein [Planococcus halocryophilus]|uniref:murein hydrolase activator EnvC family protein n=1 Tax=Planococcus halocryophilus TaxID=1215089 RepID=UPI001F0E0DA6|nr:M23 family metallopeptidase [Planococcus halocryophilus]MCH4826935.1 peptidoglycan DD-metalloendopeptidase family protein [Planococcus halocryophilus]
MISKWLVTSLSSVLALSILIPTANADTLNELEQKQQETEQQKSELTSDISEKAGQINQNVSKLDQLTAKIEELNAQITGTETKISDVQAKIDKTKVEIDELKKSIEELEKKIEEREELLKERARAIQLSGGSVDYIDVLLGANSFIDFIDRFSAVNTLIEADREIMREQAADKKLLAEQKEQVESKLAEQESRRLELVGLKASLSSKKAEQAQAVQNLEKEQKRLAAEKNELEFEHAEALEVSADLEKQIMNEQARLAEIARKEEEERQRKIAAEKAAEEARLQAEAEAAAAAAAKAAAEEKARAQAEAEAQAQAKSSAKAESASKPKAPTPAVTPPVKVEVAPVPVAEPAPSAMFIWPASGRHSSGFGGRDIGDGAESHLGQDIANVTGTPISAAATGYVSYAGNMGGYGNVVILTHSIQGQTYATVYAHMSAINVSSGQAVSQGQNVGLVGSTGRSTGPHLHFEIHVGPWNGARSNAVNPMNYF